MALFAVTLTDHTTDFVDGADAYQQEGPLTTFFAFGGERHVIDSWSTRLASYRTADITAIRRSAEGATAQGTTPDQAVADDAVASDALLATA